MSAVDISSALEAEKTPPNERVHETGPTSEDEGAFQFTTIGLCGTRGCCIVFSAKEAARSLKDSKVGGLLEEGPLRRPTHW